MSQGSSEMRLPAVPENDHQLMDPYSPTPATTLTSSNASPVSTDQPHLLRRLRNHISGRRPVTRASSSRTPNDTYNPEAPEFVPSPRMPSKRKASSNGTSRKSVLSTPRNNASNQPMDDPILSSLEVFGFGAAVSTQTPLSGLDGMDDGDSSDSFDPDSMGWGFNFAANAPAAPVAPLAPHRVGAVVRGRRDRISDTLSTMRTRPTPRPQRPADLLQSNSAILFSYEGDGSTAGEADDSARLRYLPICPATTPAWREPMGKDIPLTILPRDRERIDGMASVAPHTSTTWPPGRVPIELFDLIASHLSRDAVKSMRLVNSEFEKKVSCTLFHTSVVPFNTELYDMIDEDSRAASRAMRSGKGKGKAGPLDITSAIADPNHGSLHWTNAKYDAEGKVYKGHGLRVFRGFGPHIRRFGMSFDVLEGQLSRPPIKSELDHVVSYHGSYDWPPVLYTRFANLAGLEKTADETLRMKSAFSHLANVHDLALSVDSGLGWLNGPDKSIHARVFQRQSPIFGHSRLVPDQQTQSATEFWAAIESCNYSLGPHCNPKHISLVRRPLGKNPSELSGLRDTIYGDKRLWSSIASNRAVPTISTAASEDLQYGVMHTTFATPDSTAQSLYDKSALVPSELRKEQKEWLLETEWAQRAFLECYMLAIMDNPDKFSMVRTLAVAKISSGLLPLLARESFWDALPNLTDVTILVKPDWRTVERDNAGFADTCPQNPSEALSTFHRCILRDRLCLREGIKKLNIGWAAGGEHADGIFARNNHIMPAPITQLPQTTAASANNVLVFKYVEHLTLTNCWMTPPMLEDLVKSHAEKSLKVLTLDSVSMTAHPRFPAGGQGAGLQNQALAALIGLQGAGGAGAPNFPPPHHVVPNPQTFQNPQAPQPPSWGPPQPPLWALPNMAQHQAVNQPQLQQPQINQPQLHQPLHQQQQQTAFQNFMQQHANAPMQANLGNPANMFGAPPALLGPPPPANNPNAHFGGYWNAANNANGPGVPHLAAQAAPVVHAPWWTEHREGSWPEVLNKISPGPSFTDYQPLPAPWEEQPEPRALTTLRTIELKSCGYAKLYHSTSFDQFPIEAGHDHHLSLWFRNRQAALSPAMLTTTDRYLGRIVQHMPAREQNALLYAWGLTMGWNDRDKAEEAEYDGLLAGGTGRFSGVIEKGMQLVGGGRQQEV